MNTCVICKIAQDPFCDEDGSLLINYETGICRKCQQKIENGEIEAESYDKYILKTNRIENKYE